MNYLRKGFVQMNREKLSQIKVNQIASAVAKIIGGQHPSKGRRRSRKAPRGSGNGRQTESQRALNQIAKNAGRINDNDAHALVIKAMKAMTPNVVQIAKARVEGHDPVAASKITSMSHLTYGQVKDSAYRALVETAAQQPNVFTEETTNALRTILGTVEKNRNSFQALREMVRDDAAHGKLDANMVAFFKLTTGKLASKAVRSLQAMNEKPVHQGSFNTSNAQATYQAIVKKHDASVNSFLAKHEDDIRALCIYGYGPRDGQTIFTQLCEKADRATIARIRTESKAVSVPTQSRKAS